MSTQIELATLEKSGTRLDDFDLIIASCAMAHPHPMILCFSVGQECDTYFMYRQKSAFTFLEPCIILFCRPFCNCK